MTRPTYRPVSHDDLLPTGDVVALAKGLAARACASQAAEVAWPRLGPAVQWIERTPLVALSVLIGLCPQVEDERLARCLGVDPAPAVAALTSWQRQSSWNQAVVDAILQEVRG